MTTPTKTGFYWARVVGKTKKWPWSIVEIAIEPHTGGCLIVKYMGTDEQDDLGNEWSHRLEWGEEIKKEQSK